MAITSYSQQRIGWVTVVTVTSDLTPPGGAMVRYYWYMDGAYVATTVAPERAFSLVPGEQVRIEVIDSWDLNFDPVANAPVGWPARRAIWWCRSSDEDVDHYRVEQKKGSGDWEVLGSVAAAGRWSYSYLSTQLDDLATYRWQVVPVDAAGNDGTAIEIGPEKIVRTPDAPDFTATYDSGTEKVTFAAA